MDMIQSFFFMTYRIFFLFLSMNDWKKSSQNRCGKKKRMKRKKEKEKRQNRQKR
jgi:hypothetical protein